MRVENDPRGDTLFLPIPNSLLLAVSKGSDLVMYEHFLAFRLFPVTRKQPLKVLEIVSSL